MDGGSVAAPDGRAPFAPVTWFRAENTIPVRSPARRERLLRLIDDAIKTANLIQAIRIVIVSGAARQRLGAGTVVG